MSRIWRLYSKVEFHPLFWFMGFISVMTAQFEYFLFIFSLVFLHECAHTIAMEFYGWNVRRILLFPFGGVAETDEFHTRPIKEEFVVTIMGPLVHVIFEVVMGALLFLKIIDAGSVAYLLFLNRVLLGVNLLPIYPLDGGRIMSLLFQKMMPYYQALKCTIITSVITSVLTIYFLFIFRKVSVGNILVFFYVLFYLIGLWRQKIYVFMRFLLNRLDSFVPWMYPTVVTISDGNTLIFDLLKKLFRTRTHLFQVEGEAEKYKEHDVLFAHLYSGSEIRTLHDFKHNITND